MMELRGKRVLVVGLARTGLAAARFLSRQGAVVTVTDLRPPSAFQDVIPELTSLKVGLELGIHSDQTFLRHDLIVVSPGVVWELPQLRAAREKGVLVLPEIEVASWFLKNRLVGITGTNGKTTTTALLGKMLEASGFPTFVGGNIGVPLIWAVDQVAAEAVLVTELSSFQLQAIQSFRPHVAVLLNITPNHLDRHASFEEYVRAKAKIFSNLREEDYAVLNADDPNVMKLASTVTGPRKIFFTRRQHLPQAVFALDGQVRYRVRHLERLLVETAELRIQGEFNLENVLAACAAACVLGADFEAMRRAVREFRGVEHRLEFVRCLRGVDFYNDSKATSVDATTKALSVFREGVHLVLGGKDKGAPYAPLRPLLQERVRTVFLIGAAADRIAEELRGATELVPAGDLESAVRGAFARAKPGDTVLLSPACASFDQFQDYEHRGRVFKQVVRLLAREAGEVGQEGGGALPARSRSMPVPEFQAVSRPLERVYLYEVGAEETSPPKGGRREWPENELGAEELRTSEALTDEPLPFEHRRPDRPPAPQDRELADLKAKPGGGSGHEKALAEGNEQPEEGTHAGKPVAGGGSPPRT